MNEKRIPTGKHNKRQSEMHASQLMGECVHEVETVPSCSNPENWIKGVLVQVKSVVKGIDRLDERAKSLFDAINRKCFGKN